MKKICLLLFCIAGCREIPRKSITLLPLRRDAAAKTATAPIKARQVFHVEGFTLMLDDRELIRRMVEKRLGITNAVGFFDGKTRTLYVPFSGECDRLNRELPDFDTLGHEVWHLPELGYIWHQNPPVNLPGWKPQK